MEFDYSIYFKYNCIYPLVWVIIMIVFVVLFVRSFLLSINSEITTRVKRMIVNGVFLLVMLFLLVVHLIPLCRGGIFLLFEKETSKTTVSGIIDKIDEIDGFTGAHYLIDGKNRNGDVISINNNRYWIVTHGEYGAGDMVTLEVLPKSRYVISIQKRME